MSVRTLTHPTQLWIVPCFHHWFHVDTLALVVYDADAHALADQRDLQLHPTSVRTPLHSADHSRQKQSTERREGEVHPKYKERPPPITHLARRLLLESAREVALGQVAGRWHRRNREPKVLPTSVAVICWRHPRLMQLADLVVAMATLDTLQEVLRHQRRLVAGSAELDLLKRDIPPGAVAVSWYCDLGRQALRNATPQSKQKVSEWLARRGARRLGTRTTSHQRTHMKYPDVGGSAMVARAAWAEWTW